MISVGKNIRNVVIIQKDKDNSLNVLFDPLKKRRDDVNPLYPKMYDIIEKKNKKQPNELDGLMFVAPLNTFAVAFL